MGKDTREDKIFMIDMVFAIAVRGKTLADAKDKVFRADRKIVAEKMRYQRMEAVTKNDEGIGIL